MTISASELATALHSWGDATMATPSQMWQDGWDSSKIVYTLATCNGHQSFSRSNLQRGYWGGLKETSMVGCLLVSGADGYDQGCLQTEGCFAESFSLPALPAPSISQVKSSTPGSFPCRRPAMSLMASRGHPSTLRRLSLPDVSAVNEGRLGSCSSYTYSYQPDGVFFATTSDRRVLLMDAYA